MGQQCLEFGQNGTTFWIRPRSKQFVISFTKNGCIENAPLLELDMWSTPIFIFFNGMNIFNIHAIGH